MAEERAPAAPDAAPEERVRNPFRNEADAFRVLAMFVAAGALVVAVALLVSSTAGFVLALVLAAVGLWRALGLWQTWRRHGSAPSGR